MAAKKTAKKKVTVEIDAETLLALLDAAESLAEIISAKVIRSEDPELRAMAKKRAKKSTKKGR